MSAQRTIALTLAVALLGAGAVGCADGSGTAPATHASSSTGQASTPPTTLGTGAILVEHPDDTTERSALQPDGTVGPATALSWKSGARAEGILLADALGPWALTRVVVPPITDVSATTSLQLRDIATGAVLQELAVDGWCSGPDGASYPCLLLDGERVVRTTPIDTEHEGTITISDLATGATLGEFGPFEALAGVLPTDDAQTLVVVTFDGAAQAFDYLQLDTRSGQTSAIGTVPVGQPALCVLGSDAILTARDGVLQAIGPAQVAAVAVPELGDRGPGVEGCSSDGRFLYVRTDTDADPAGSLTLDALRLADGTRTAAVLATSDAWLVRVTR